MKQREPADTRVGDGVLTVAFLILAALIIGYAALPELREWFAVMGAP